MTESKKLETTGKSPAPKAAEPKPAETNKIPEYKGQDGKPIGSKDEAPGPYLKEEPKKGQDETKSPVPPLEAKDDPKIEGIAKVCHEANRGYCIAIGEKGQVPWDKCPEWQKESAMAGVKAVIADPSITPEKMHESWARHKRDDGWRHGPVKDPEKKLHPQLVPYIELPQRQQAKYYIFLAIVKSLLGV